MTVRKSTGLVLAENKAWTARPAAGLLPAFFINIYSGAQPASPDAAATGTLLAKITVSGDGSTALQWEAEGDVADRDIYKLASQSWMDLSCDNSGTAGWGRIYEGSDTPGNSSTSAKRVDFSITVTNGGGDMELASTSVVQSTPFAIPVFKYSRPL